MVILQFVIALVTADDSISDQQDANFQWVQLINFWWENLEVVNISCESEWNQIGRPTNGHGVVFYLGGYVSIASLRAVENIVLPRVRMVFCWMRAKDLRRLPRYTSGRTVR